MVDFIVDPEGNTRDCRNVPPPSGKKPGEDWKALGYLSAGMLGLELWVYSQLLALERGELESVVVLRPIGGVYKTLGFTGAVLVLPTVWATIIFAWGCFAWLDRFGRGRAIMGSVESCLARLSWVLAFLFSTGVGGFLLFLVSRDAITGENNTPPWLLIPTCLMLGLGWLIITGVWRGQ